MSGADELHHTIKQIARQELASRQPFAYGHIATYDPTTGSVKVVYPSVRNEDGTPTMSPWMPLSTGWSGPTGQAFGIQYVPVGGASLEDPTAGEQVLVSIIDSENGAAVGASICFNQAAPPPRNDLLPGELAIQTGAATFVRFHKNGDIEINTSGPTPANTIINCQNATITATGVVNIFATAIKLAASLSATVQALCTAAFEAWAATHEHAALNAPPTAAPPGNSLTTIVTAE